MSAPRAGRARSAACWRCTASAPPPLGFLRRRRPWWIGLLKTDKKGHGSERLRVWGMRAVSSYHTVITMSNDMIPHEWSL